MIPVAYSTWEQTPEDLRGLGVTATHPRTRERFFALYEMTQAGCATRVVEGTGRTLHTLLRWVHRYNEHGPTGMTYQRTGGPPPFVPSSRALSSRKSTRPCVLRRRRP